MIEAERKKLENRENRYISIGITQGGIPRGGVAVPWEMTANAFNMKTPKIYISPEDLEDKELMALLETYKVIGCYIWAPLEDYGFLARFKDLMDIHIKNGDAIRDLEFLSDLCECSMLYLQNAKLENLDVIIDVKKRSRGVFGRMRCICLDNCEVKDISAFENENLRFSEFLVWRPEGSNEHERWKIISAIKRVYFEYKLN